MTPNNKMNLPSGKTPLVTWILLVSVVLNLFLVGVVAGILPGFGRHHPPLGLMALASPHGDSLDGWIERHLEPADAAAFRDIYKGQSAALKDADLKVRDAVRGVTDAFEREPADQAALQDALKRVKDARAEVHKIVDQITEDAYKKLSPEGRRRLAELVH